MIKVSCIFLFLLLSLPIYAEDTQPIISFESVQKDIRSFAKQMANKHQFNELKILKILTPLKVNGMVIKKISKPAESMAWSSYRKIWMTDERINGGIEFWEKNKATLQRAEQVYGVETAMIVAIIGVETFYGTNQGSFSVLDALNSLSFYYPKRAVFFRGELAEYFVLARKQGWDLNQIKGSYAGAMGMGQFISSSYRRFGVDFNQDGKINLFNDPVDMIGSIANYFSKHGWKNNGFVFQPIKLTQNQQHLVQYDLELVYSLNELKAFGLNIEQLKNKTDKAGVFVFDGENGKEYWLGGENFYTITRYNINAMYALAIFQLSQAIKAKR